MKKLQIVALTGALLMLGAKSAPLHAQEDSIVWLGVPISISYQFPMQDIPNASFGDAENVLSRLDLDLGLQLFFRLGDTVSLGVESGVSAPIADYVYLAMRRSPEEAFGYPFHIPLRVVLNVAAEDIDVDIFGGTNFNIIFNSFSTLTADVGFRFNFFGFFVMLGYTFPVEVTIESTVASAVQNYWQNSLRIGGGFRIGGP